MDCRLKLTLCLGLAAIWNVFGAENCKNLTSQTSYLMAAGLSHRLGGACTLQAALDAVNCFQNTCLQSLQSKSASDQATCYSRYCGGTFCAFLSSSQLSDFVSAYSQVCNGLLPRSETISEVVPGKPITASDCFGSFKGRTIVVPCKG